MLVKADRWHRANTS